MKKIFQKLLLFFYLFIVFIPIVGFAGTSIIKVAVLDNINDPSLPADYKISYLQGIATAMLAAQDQGYTVQYKTFFYGNQPLAILNEIPLVKVWQPDVIIGPHFSNEFLLLKNDFNDVLVISPDASDPALATMPTNFYSLSLTDDEIYRSEVYFIDKTFPNKNIFNIVAADCKDCVDSNNLFNNLYNKINPSIKMTNSMYVGDVNALNIAKLMANYQKGDIIVLQADSFLSSQQLIFRITSHFSKYNFIFINYLDNWGKNNIIMPNKNYTEYWMAPYLMDSSSKNYQKFLQYYLDLYKIPPQTTISYLSFLTLFSVTTALSEFSSNQSGIMKENILKSYEIARNKNQNWFKPISSAVYKIDAQGIQFIEIVPIH